MATPPPPEFVDTQDVPGPARPVLEDAVGSEPAPQPRVVLESAEHAEARLGHQQANVTAPPPSGETGSSGVRDDLGLRDSVGFRRGPGFRDPAQRPDQPSRWRLPQWTAGLNDGSMPTIRVDQVWGLIAACLLVVLIVLAVQRAPSLPSFGSIESGAPGSPAGPSADPAIVSRSSDSLNQSASVDDDGVMSQPADNGGRSSRAKIFARSERKTSRTTATSGSGSGENNSIDFNADSGAGDIEPDEPGGNGDNADRGGTTVSDAGSTTPSGESRRSPSSGDSGSVRSPSPTTRITIDTTTSTSSGLITTRPPSTREPASSTSIRSTTQPATSSTTETTTSDPTTTRERVTSSSTSTSTTTTASSATTPTVATTAPPTTSNDPEPDDPEPDEPGDDPEPDGAGDRERTRPVS